MLNVRTLTSGHETGKRSRLKRLFCAANSNLRGKVSLKPGPFLDARELKQAGRGHPVHALITALLVVYPVFASVAVVIAGMWLLGTSA
jgi:hypothetical protein